MSFDHILRDRDLVVERYLARQLTDEEAARFEEHYLDCPECLDQLEAARALRRGLATVAAEDLVRPASLPRPWLAAAALVLAALLPAAWLWRNSRQLEQELAAAITAHTDLRAGFEKELGERRTEIAELASERSRLEEELSREREPQLNMPYLPLAALRSGAEAATVRVAQPTGPGRLVVGLAVGPDETGPFRGTLLIGDRELWRGEGLRPDVLGEVRISFHGSSLAPGEYVLVLTGPGGRGGGRYAFRVLSPGGADPRR